MTTAPPKPTNVVAAIALVVSMIMPLAGICLGVVALRQIATTRELGRGLAISAIVLGGVGAVVILAALLFAVAVSVALGWTRISLGAEYG